MFDTICGELMNTPVNEALVIEAEPHEDPKAIRDFAEDAIEALGINRTAFIVDNIVYITTK